jgi:nitrogen fixation/metabolism regulation signal transduction histidine kinase
MIEAGHLQEAFTHFTAASKTLEAYYQKLQDQVLYLTGVLEETNQQLSEALSRAEEAKDFLNGILQSLSEAIIVLNPGQEITMINKGAEDLLGLKASEAIGRSIHKLEAVFEEEGTDTYLTAGKKRFQVILSRARIQDGDGQLRGYVVLIKDISYLKELETQRERNKRLIAMGEMAAKLVHEIRNPLCSIELYATMLAGDLENTSHAEMARGISRGIQSLNHVLNNMHFFAIPQKPVFVRVDFEKVIGELLFMLKPLIESKGIRLKKTFKGQSRLWGDGELIKQVVMNLLLNALEASPEAGTVELILKPVGGGVALEIKDQGPGIPADLRERIFDPFFSQKEKGSGLGLSIAANIMQAHGGSITAKSEEGRGACFQLVFPMPREQGASVREEIGKGINPFLAQRELSYETYSCC